MVSENYGQSAMAKICSCLNPCFGGIWSLSPEVRLEQLVGGRLNPCFGGIWSLSKLNSGEKMPDGQS